MPPHLTVSIAAVRGLLRETPLHIRGYRGTPARAAYEESVASLVPEI